VLRDGVGLNEVKIRTEAEIREKAFREGHCKGYGLAESKYKLNFRCSVCRAIIDVDNDATKKAIGRHLEEYGWGHAECIDRK